MAEIELRCLVYQVGEYRVEDRGPNEHGQRTWCVKDLSHVLNRDGQWEYEPTAGNRTKDFIKRTRFTAAEAIVAAIKAQSQPGEQQ